MFTGIIEEIGTVRDIRRQGHTLLLRLSARAVLEGLRLGDSIAVNGVCLTAVQSDAASVTMDVMPETFRKSTLRDLSPGSPVNLERAMALGARFGGHIVQGHVDGIGVIRERRAEENAVHFRIAPESPDLLRKIVPTGSVALDGISLTVAEAGTEDFRVSIIPHTLRQTILQGKRPGDALNIECDILGKYIEALLARRSAGPTVDGTPERTAEAKGGITMEMLIENGF